MHRENYTQFYEITHFYFSSFFKVTLLVEIFELILYKINV